MVLSRCVGLRDEVVSRQDTFAISSSYDVPFTVDLVGVHLALASKTHLRRS